MNIAPQIRFIITSSKAKLSQSDIEYIRDYISKYIIDDIAVDDTIATISRHGLIPLVYHTLRDLSSDIDIPSTLLSKLQARYKLIAQKNMLMSAELIKIVKLLAKHDIKAIPFKGPSLAQLAYGDITLRVFGDLDILVNKEDIDRVYQILQTIHYERYLSLTPYQYQVWLKYSHDLGLTNKSKNIHLEMHWSFFDEDYPMQIDMDSFDSTTSTTINNNSIDTFEIESLLFYLSIHGSKHLFERISWIKDLDMMIRLQDIHWDKIDKLMKTNPDFTKMFLLGLQLSWHLYSTPLPTDIKEQIANHPELKTLQQFIIDSWATTHHKFAQTKMMLLLFPNLKTRLSYLHKIILKPQLHEYWYIDLPKSLHWGYYLIRPYLLIKKYLITPPNK
jgi:hypothetical protein